MLYRDLDQQTKEDLKNYFEERDYAIIAVPKEEPIRVYVIKADRVVETARRVHQLTQAPLFYLVSGSCPL